jgi:uncharacterized membrane protein YedE/YeeE
MHALAGGVLIGLASSALWLLNGRVAGISGITGGLLARPTADTGWRLLFVGGLVTGGVLLRVVVAEPFGGLAGMPPAMLLAAGFLVGLGASLGNGCTSGHGVCGVSRGSPRSIVATLTFMAVGALTVFVVRHVFGAAQ